MEGALYHKSGDVVTPLKIKEPETDLIRLERIKGELEDMIQRCQSMLFTAAEEAPDETEMDAMQERLAELREQIDTITGE